MSKFARVILSFLIFAISPLFAGEPAIIDPAKVDADFAIQGEYSGETKHNDAKEKTGFQVIALGGGKFRGVLLHGGLPGDGWDKSKKEEADGASVAGAAKIEYAQWVATIQNGELTLATKTGEELGKLKHVIRESPTAGAKPPEGALVLFDGSNLEQWQKGASMTEDKLLVQGPTTVKKFGSYTLHVEFMLSYMPAARGQGRSNSGVYNQSRYEIQVLDSFGLSGAINEAGAVYSIKAPLVNMCYPPLSWQTYDIDFTAAQYEGDKKVKNARATVKHNGVLVQDDTEIPHTTTSSPLKEGPEPGPIHLQNHGNPVRFRNVWIVEKK